MKTVTPTELRSDIYRLLDEILATGIPLEIKKGDKKLRVVPVLPVSKFQNLIERPEAICGNPDELVDIHWEDEVKVDLP